MAKVSKRQLIEAALEAREHAVALHSGFRVGAALLTRHGVIVRGANVESASYGLTCCAERVALFTALTAGEREFAALAVVAAIPHGPTPCGACRQLLAEYAGKARIWIADANHPERVRSFRVSELLPKPFLFFGGDSDLRK